MKQRCPDLPDQHITVEDLRGVFKTWRESTSTSPSGRHLGHMKTLTAINHDLDWPSDITRPQAIFTCIAEILQLCMTHCLPLERWLTVHNMMIHKEPGNNKIHRLRVIHIQ